MKSAPKDVCERAMEALDEELVLPRDLEERMLDAVSDVRSAVEPLRAPASLAPQRRASRFAVAAVLAAVAAGMALGLAAWLSERGAAVEASAASADAVDAAERAARRVAEVDWADPTPWREKMALLEALRVRIEALSDPVAIARVAPRYADGVRRGFLDAGKASLERALGAGSGAWFLEERANLEEYLLLDDPAHLASEADWEIARLGATCAETVAAAGRVGVDAIRPIVQPHVATYVKLLERGLVRGVELDARLVERTRGVLAHAEPRGYFDVFVTPLVDQAKDPERAPAGDNLAYPPITLDGAIGDKPDALVESRSRKSWGTPYEVLGVYTGPARRAVLRSLAAARDELARGAWVVGDEAADARGREALDRVRDDYDGLYVHEWESFLRDVEIARPTPGKDGSRRLRSLAASDSPLVRLLGVVVEHTRPVASSGIAAGDPVALRFEALARFVGPSGGLAAYRTLLGALADDLEAGRRIDARVAAAEVRALVSGGDEAGREALVDLLAAPFEPAAVAPRQ